MKIYLITIGRKTITTLIPEPPGLQRASSNIVCAIIHAYAKSSDFPAATSSLHRPITPSNIPNIGKAKKASKMPMEKGATEVANTL
jgi:hypothetical protein